MSDRQKDRNPLRQMLRLRLKNAVYLFFHTLNYHICLFLSRYMHKKEKENVDAALIKEYKLFGQTLSDNFNHIIFSIFSMKLLS